MRHCITLKKSELLALYEALEEIKDKHNKNFTYAVAFAKKAIKNDAEALLDAMKPSDSYNEYEKEKMEIIKKFAEVDDSDKMIIKNGAIKIVSEKAQECQEAINAMEDKYKEVLDQRQKDYENFDRVLDETTEVQLELVEWDYVPDLEQSLMDALLPIITRG